MKETHDSMKEKTVRNVYLYPHSLSYQETSFTKEELRAIPALASNMLDLKQRQNCEVK